MQLQRISGQRRRQGGITSIVAILLLPLLSMLAFAIDLNFLWRADAELQNAADAAALAGASELFAYAAPGNHPAVSSIPPAQLRSLAERDARAVAVAYGQQHRVANTGLAVNADDVGVGYITDPAAASSTTTGSWQTGPTAPFPNSIRVTVRRDGQVGPGPLSLYFGGLLGAPQAARQASATATLRGQNISGFRGAGGRLLPLAMSLATFNRLTGASATTPIGVTPQDLWTLRPVATGGSPPTNVTAGADGTEEAKIFPDKTTAGNFGLLSLRNSKATSAGTYDNWIRNGPSDADLASFGASGLQAPLDLHGGPGLKASEEDAFRSIIGQPRTLVVYDNYSGSGSNTTYHVVHFLGAAVVAVDLNGKDKYVTIQLTPTLDPTAVRTGNPAATTLIYSGVSLTR
ncbi:MAG: hypothetical protein JNM56_11860 [Planctomycetia bacterium]|nr:hypothetical protein [Planctomycetia bacterium]